MVEWATLETQAGDDFREFCEVHGRIRNDSTRNHAVTLHFTAFNPQGRLIGGAVTSEKFVAAGGRSTYRAEFGPTFSLEQGFAGGLSDCDKVHRFEVEIDARPV